MAVRNGNYSERIRVFLHAFTVSFGALMLSVVWQDRHLALKSLCHLYEYTVQSDTVFTLYSRLYNRLYSRLLVYTVLEISAVSALSRWLLHLESAVNMRTAEVLFFGRY